MRSVLGLVFGVVVAMVCVQCKGGGEQAAPQAADTPKAMTSSPMPASEGEREPTASKAVPQKKLVLLAGIEYPTEGAPPPFEVELNYADEGRVTGSATLDGTALSVNGVFEDDQFRLWVTGKPGDEERVRRGYLIGELKDGTVSGSFAISGNGGTPAYRGTLKGK